MRLPQQTEERLGEIIVKLRRDRALIEKFLVNDNGILVGMVTVPRGSRGRVRYGYKGDVLGEAELMNRSDVVRWRHKPTRNMVSNLVLRYEVVEWLSND